MKHLLIALSLAAAASVTLARTPHAGTAASDASTGSATATSPAAPVATTEPGTPQRSKMKLCNAEAKTKGIHGPDRRAFMKQCLSGKAKPATAS